ncbi:MAG: TonB-dependent receptor [Gemmatimonadetes bacterium]|nr:TonB-dependent receptor [Gemmatimonadota bacterium]
MRFLKLFFVPGLAPLGLLFAASGAVAQTAVLTGQVLDVETRTPLPGAVVRVLAQGIQVLSDGEGRFRIEGVAPGMVRLEASTLGYSPTIQTSVMARTSRPTYVSLELRPAAIEVEGITVQANVFQVREDAPTSTQRLTEVEIRRTPGGVGDISRSLLSLPGVLSGVDSRSNLLVRGGGPGENAYYLDGIRIPQINHFATQGTAGGALALVNADFIQDATFFTGGFPVAYGDALSSVLLIRNRPGTEDGIAGDVTLGASEAGITLDGPLGTEGNWLFSVRRSYLQFLFEALGLPLRPDYWDGQFSGNWEPSSRDQFTFTGIGAIDELGIIEPDPDADYEYQEIFQSVLDNDQKSYTVGGTYRRLVGDGGIFRLTASRSFTEFRFSDEDADGEALIANTSVEKEARFRVEGDAGLGSAVRVSVGGEAVRASVDARVYQRAISGGLLTEDVLFDNDAGFWKPAVWGQVIWRPGPLTATVGVRGDGVTALNDSWAWGPRASLRYSTSAGVDLSLAGGIFHQAPSKLALSVEQDGAPANAGLSQLENWQLVGGADWRVNPGLRFRAEAFYKDYDQMPVLASDPRINLANLGDDYGFVGAEPLLSSGTGRAYGGELFLQQKLTGSIFLLGAYTLAWSEYAGEGGVLRPSAWDRRHALDFTGGYRIGGAWEIGSKLRFLSGVAYTPWDLDASAETYPLTGRGVRDWSRAGSERAPAYVRLDLRIERQWFFQRWDAVVYFDFQNLLGRENTVGFSYTQDPAFPDRLRPIDSVGLLPTFGFSVEF